MEKQEIKDEILNVLQQESEYLDMGTNVILSVNFDKIVNTIYNIFESYFDHSSEDSDDGIWFHIKSKLPADGQRVLVYGENNNHKVYTFITACMGGAGWRLEPNQEDDNDPIIKWKPLPLNEEEYKAHISNVRCLHCGKSISECKNNECLNKG